MSAKNIARIDQIGEKVRVFYKSGKEKNFTEKTLPKTAQNFMYKAIKSGRWWHFTDTDLFRFYYSK